MAPSKFRSPYSGFLVGIATQKKTAHQKEMSRRENADPELARLIYWLEELNDQDRVLARRFLGLLLGDGK